MLLDTRPAGPNKPLQMETQYIPSVQSTDAKGEIYARVVPTSFPREPQGDSVMLHRVTAYNRSALWEAVKSWLVGGPAATGVIDPQGAAVQTFPGKGGATWKIYTPSVTREMKVALDWKSLATAIAPDPTTFGFRWNDQLVD